MQARGPYRLPVLCLGVLVACWLIAAIDPVDRPTWALESLPSIVLVPLLVVTFRVFRFSDRSYVQATVFLILHTIGSHYTYSQVPFGTWLASTFDWSRNHYDRIVHAASGVLLLRPCLDLVFRRTEASALVKSWTGVASIVCGGVIYEALEWVTAIVVDPSSGTAFLGTQGDIWDAQKDLALALLGAGVASLELTVPALQRAAVRWRTRLRLLRDRRSWRSCRKRAPDAPAARTADPRRVAG